MRMARYLPNRVQFNWRRMHYANVLPGRLVIETHSYSMKRTESNEHISWHQMHFKLSRLVQGPADLSETLTSPLQYLMVTPKLKWTLIALKKPLMLFFLKSNAETQYCNKPEKQPSSAAAVQLAHSVPTDVNHGEAHALPRHKLRLPNCLEPPPSLPPTHHSSAPKLTNSIFPCRLELPPQHPHPHPTDTSPPAAPGGARGGHGQEMPGCVIRVPPGLRRAGGHLSFL